MKKRLNATSIANELKNGSRFFSPQAEDDVASGQPETTRLDNEDNEISIEPEPTAHSMQRSASQSFSQSTGRSTAQSANLSTAESTTASAGESMQQSTANRYDESPILGRPKAFYISHQQDKDLDLAVAMLASGEFGPQTQKIDRSSLVRLLLEEIDVTSEKTLQRLQQRNVNRQLYQLNSRRPSRPQR